MGWLFALALGLQEKSKAAILRSLLPIALGHAIAISLVVVLLHFVQGAFPQRIVRIVVALVLFGLGLFRLFRSSHPKGARMKASSKDLVLWSFLMASAHGAGLMLVPILLAQPAVATNHSMHTAHVARAVATTPAMLGLAVVLHTVSLLFVAGTLALLFFLSYEKYGLSLLQRTWLNFDLIWAIALLLAAVLALLI